MAGRSKVSQHPARDSILEELEAGATIASLARKYSLSESSVSRFKSSTLRANANDFDNAELSLADIMQRLVDLVNSTHRARVRADQGLSPQLRSKAQALELQALEKLLVRTGITDTTVVGALKERELVLMALREFVSTRPDAVPDLLNVLGRFDGTQQLRDAIRAQTRKKNS